MARTLSADELRARLERHEPISIVDIRDEDEVEEWRIPGASHADVYDGVVAHDANAFDALGLPRDQPVAVVCWAGNTSRIGQEILEARGYDAYSLEGGMRAWSLAWNLAELSTRAGTRIVQVRRTGKGCLSYIVGSKGEALVVDPSLAPDIYVSLAKERGWTLRHVLDTHVHADHLSRARVLAERAGATLHLPETQRARYAHATLRDGDELRVGDAKLRVLATPGHTAESACYLIDEHALLTGDTLFLDSIGRPDLEASAEETRSRAAALHASLSRVFQLPSDTLVLPCHTGEPIEFDGKPLAARLGEIRPRLSLLDLPPERFVDALLPRIPTTPPNHKRVVALNEAGELPASDVTELEAGANRCAIR